MKYHEILIMQIHGYAVPQNKSQHALKKSHNRSLISQITEGKKNKLLETIKLNNLDFLS